MEKYKINVSNKELNFLTNLIKDIDIDILTYDNNKIFIYGNKKMLSILLDRLSDLLIYNGLESNDEPNSFGLEIENMIGKVSSVVY